MDECGGSENCLDISIKSIVVGEDSQGTTHTRSAVMSYVNGSDKENLDTLHVLAPHI